jgi:hypothetical protein
MWHKAKWQAEQWAVCFIHVADKPETARYRSSTSSHTWNGSTELSNKTTGWWCDSKYSLLFSFILLFPPTKIMFYLDFSFIDVSSTNVIGSILWVIERYWETVLVA